MLPSSEVTVILAIPGAVSLVRSPGRLGGLALLFASIPVRRLFPTKGRSGIHGFVGFPNLFSLALIPVLALTLGYVCSDGPEMSEVSP